MLGRRASSPRYIQEHRELRTIRSEARRLQQELHLASAREAALAQQLGRSRAEAAELGARLASVQDSSRASKRSAREALAELAEENAKLVAAYEAEKEDRAAWEQRLRALQLELEVSKQEALELRQQVARLTSAAHQQAEREEEEQERRRRDQQREERWQRRGEEKEEEEEDQEGEGDHGSGKEPPQLPAVQQAGGSGRDAERREWVAGVWRYGVWRAARARQHAVHNAIPSRQRQPSADGGDADGGLFGRWDSAGPAATAAEATALSAAAAALHRLRQQVARQAQEQGVSLAPRAVVGASALQHMAERNRALERELMAMRAQRDADRSRAEQHGAEQQAGAAGSQPAPQHQQQRQQEQEQQGQEQGQQQRPVRVEQQQQQAERAQPALRPGEQDAAQQQRPDQVPGDGDPQQEGRGPRADMPLMAQRGDGKGTQQQHSAKDQCGPSDQELNGDAEPIAAPAAAAATTAAPQPDQAHRQASADAAAAAEAVAARQAEEVAARQAEEVAALRRQAAYLAAENARLQRSVAEAAALKARVERLQQAEKLKQLGNRSYQGRQHRAAYRYYTEALQLKVEDATFNAVLYCNRAAALQALGHHLDAVADCCVAAHLDGRYPRVLQRRAEAFGAIGDYGSACADLQRLCELVQAQHAAQQAQHAARAAAGAGAGKEVHADEDGGGGADAAAVREARARMQEAEQKLAARGREGVDHYSVLGLPPSATAADVKASYRRLALKYHPDKATHASHKAAADVIFKLVTAAYSVLSDPQKRSEHDRRRALGVGAFGGLGAAAAAAHAHAHRPFASGAAGGAAGPMSDAGDSSRHSYSTGASGAGSSAASDTSDAAALNALADRGDNNDGSMDDLMDSTRKLDEGIFAMLVLLNKNRGLVDIRWVLLRMLFECLQLFRIVFNTYFTAWSINKEQWAFKAIHWVLIRGLVFPKGYDMYIRVFYALAAIVFVSLILAAWLAIVLKKDDATEAGWTGKLIAFLQFLCFLVYTVCWITILDFVVFRERHNEQQRAACSHTARNSACIGRAWGAALHDQGMEFNCKWAAIGSGASNVVHMYFGNSCLAMPHLAHMVFAVVVFFVFCTACLALSVGDCDLNPLTRNVLATPS
ncbi:Chaperone protein dnaJ [Monoraphidium neglectum]|uniref:Chaperone protein dnaJ n=1 Tax=Monoraphidium neglectum TaxID=145388 RepID=A0A0D2K0F3_9CHLO|nr:Chaperone protein dnaJ [Monoraphidium neglectum]KIZ04138.1 Chaperone protein dnaJ [Monoraphidium neglectum]|eukprot:XP_013903157.1 Chaperone protein dnaJ [Monoraphidium neglectum]